MINRNSKSTEEKKWPCDVNTCVIGAAISPSFHADELSFIFVRDDSKISLINTQTWHVTELVDLGDGPKFPDLHLFDVIEEENQISIFTMKGQGHNQLIKRTYSDLLKYCMQTSSIKSSVQARDPLRGQSNVNTMRKDQSAPI